VNFVACHDAPGIQQSRDIGIRHTSSFTVVPPAGHRVRFANETRGRHWRTGLSTAAELEAAELEITHATLIVLREMSPPRQRVCSALRYSRVKRPLQHEAADDARREIGRRHEPGVRADRAGHPVLTRLITFAMSAAPRLPGERPPTRTLRPGTP
jgi:hypothetical protein